MASSAAVAAYLTDRARSAKLYEMLEPYSGQPAGVGELWLGSVSRCLGILAATLGRIEDGEAHSATAEATHERIGAPTWLARTRLEWARMLLNRQQPGDAERARELLEQTLATARELGLANVERRAVDLLQ